MTLGAFGFTKKVQHRDKTVCVDIPLEAPDETKKLNCDYCVEHFKNQQGLTVHMKSKHTDSFPKRKKRSLNGIRPPSDKDEVKSVIPDLVKAVVLEVKQNIHDEKSVLSERKTNERRGADKRKQYTVTFKAQVISDFEAGESDKTLESKYFINRSLVQKWNKDKNKIFAEAASRHKKNSLKIRSARKYDDLYRCLLVKFKSARGKGHRVNFHWLWSNARKNYRDQQGNPIAVIKKHVIVALTIFSPVLPLA